MKTLRDSKLIILSSVAIALLTTVASILGLLTPDIYGEETANWATQARGQDVGNLMAVVVLLASGYLYSRGSHKAALVWVGTLFYLVYAYIVYAMAVHFNVLFLVYVAVLGLSSYSLLFTVNRLRAIESVFPTGRTSKFAGYTLVTIGLLFSFLWLSELIPALLSNKVPQSIVDAGLWVNPIHVIDLSIVLPGFIIAGYLAAKNHHNGLFFVGPWLIFSVLMGASIVAAMIMMTMEGFAILPPLIMVSAVVVASFLAAWHYLARIRQ